MKPLKNASLVFFIAFMACGISNWGNELTKNPVLVTIGLIVSGLLYGIADAFSD